MSDNSQKQFLLCSCSSLSKASWPRSQRRLLSTTRVAQLRRRLFSSFFWERRTLVCCALWGRRTVRFCSHHLGALLAMFFLLFVFYLCFRFSSLFSIFAIIFLLYILFTRILARPRPRSLLGRVPVTYYPPSSSLPLVFPSTPVATTPLVRVLETIDLSSSNVKHFLEEEERALAESEIPASQAGSLTCP